MNILGIGNSFSSDSFEYIQKIANNLGYKDIFLQNLDHAGCSIDMHINYISNDLPEYFLKTCKNGEWEIKKESKASEIFDKNIKWDYISIQQASYETGLEETYKNLDKLVELIKQRSDAKLVWNMTWAYQNDTTHPAFPNYNCDQLFMYNKILETVKKCVIPNSNFIKIMPTGTAIQNARSSHFGDHLTRDGFHLSFDFGRLVVALVYVKMLLGLDISKCTFIPENSDEQKLKVAIESALNAVDNPFEITKSKF